MELTFTKIDERWYVELPEWEGSFDDLEMVNGADTLLEILSQRLGRNSLTFEIWLYEPDTPCGMLRKIMQDWDGATYQVENCMYYDGTAWLCNVTKFVFGGYHPDTIYFRVDE